nr:MAG TPA: RecT protein [Caudoviricetes sp.]
MTQQTTATPAVAQPQANTLKGFNKTLADQRTQDYLQQVLSVKKSSFVNNITALVANSAGLQACDPLTIIYAGIKATALDLPLDPNLGFAYVIPYKRKDATAQAQFQLGYKGFVQLAIRSGQFQAINVTEVREGELQDFDLLTGETRFTAKPNRETLPVIGYVAYFRLTNGFSKCLYMTRDEVEAHALRYSETYKSTKAWVKASSKWTTDFDAMAKKTVLKLLLSKYAPLSVEMQNAIKSDQAVIDERGEAHYVDHDEYTSVEDVTNAVATEVEEETATEELEVDTETGEVLKPSNDASPAPASPAQPQREEQEQPVRSPF